MSDATPRRPGADRNLLFGILALQMDFISRDALIAAMHGWVLDKAKPLAQLLVEQEALLPDNRALLEPLVRRHLEMHDNDPQQSLAAVNTIDSVRDDLRQLADPDVQASLAHVTPPRPTPDPAATRPDMASPAARRFLILRPHARGGLGAVYVAHDEELNREVALKEIQEQHAHNPESRARFLLEAEVTGQLEHPGVVPVYSLGHYSDGRPFYAMRFVRGDSLKDAIARFHKEKNTLPAGERTLRLRQLLGRFVYVCNAVAYAHSRGVLHRDLKPGNIMLGKYGETLVVDWGLAKVLDRADPETSEGPLRPALSGDSGMTQTGAALGTPAYMSPEQAAGRLSQLGPRTDVYSLGATLYSLLTGQPPFAEDDVGAELARVQRGDFPRPRELDRRVPPALEAVCCKAMALRPEDRYPSPQALADDLEKWLADEPVMAYREPPAGRAARWMRRHRTGVGAGVAAAGMAILCLAAAAGLLLAAYREADWQRVEAGIQRDRANAQRDKARDHFLLARTAVDQFHTRVSESPDLKAHGLELLRQKLLESAAEYYQKFVEQQDDDPGLRAEQGRACRRLADLAHILGRNDQARAGYDQARAIFRQLAEADAQQGAYQEELALCELKLAVMYHDAGHYALAEPPYQEALTRGQRLCDAQPEVLAYQQDLGNIQHSLARLYRDSGRYALAEPLYDQALTLRRRLVKDHPGEIVYQDELAWTLFNLANLYKRTGRRDLSEKTYLENLDIWQRLADGHAESPDYQDQVGMTLNNLGNLYEDTGRPRQAEDTRLKALDVRLRLAEAHPQVEDYQEALCKIHENLGSGYQMSGQLELAERSYRQALTIRQRLLDRYPDILSIAANHAANEGNMGLLCRDRAQWQEALDWYGRAARRLEAVLQKEPSHSVARTALRSVEGRRAVVLGRLGRRPEAEQALERAALGGPEPTDRESRLCRALVRAYAGDRVGAASRADDVAREAGLAGYELFDLARIYCLCQDGARAVEVLRRARVAGYLQSAASVERLRNDADLTSLSSDPDFRQLLAELDRQKK